MTAAHPQVTSARQRHNALSRHRGADDPATLNARRDLRFATLAELIRHDVDAEPPLTEAQRDDLAALLRGVDTDA